MKRSILLLAVSVLLVQCSRGPARFDKLKIEAIEVGDLPVALVPEVPEQEGVVKWWREKPGIVKAVYRKRLSCPARMINSVAGIEVKPDRILLCWKPVLTDSKEASPLSACPYDLAVKYEMWGIPEDVEPKFEPKDGCDPVKQ